MRIIIYGAGGIGGVIGARLHQSGCEVVLIARGAHLDALRRDGLRLIAPGEDERIAVPAAGHPREIDFAVDDVVLLTMKSQHTAAALEDLRAHAGTAVPVICCQNGVANERMAARRFANVYGTVVILPALHLEPGEVATHAAGAGGILDTGCFPTGVDDTVTRVTQALSRAGFSARPDPAVMRQKHAKLLMNLSNALAAVTDMGDGARDFSRTLKHEALACFRAAGIDCASVEESRARREVLSMAEIPGVPRTAGSSWQSIVRGTGNIETDYLNGEIVLLGRLHGVPTPANAALARAAARVVRMATPEPVPVAALLDEVSASQ